MKRVEQNPAVQLLKDFCKHYNERNLENLLSLFCQDHQVHCYGTGVDEDRLGIEEVRQQIIRDWEQSEKALILAPKEFYTSEGSVCWAAGDFKAEISSGGKKVSISHLRISIYGIREKDAWKISHMHNSFPAQNQSEGRSFPQ